MTSLELAGDNAKRNPKVWREAGEIIRQRVAQQTLSSQNLRIKAAITAAVIAGELKEGDQLPPEPKIAELTGISLGTVRRALAKLALDGIVERSHGRGTFISHYSGYLNERWHIRFMDPSTGEIVPTQMRLLERKIIFDSGPWTLALGQRQSYVRLRRLAVVGPDYFVINELTFDGEQFANLMRIPAVAIEDGVRHLIAVDFQSPVLSSRRSAKLEKATREMAALMNVEEGKTVMKVTVVALTFDDAPVFHSSTWIPELPFELDMTPISQSYSRATISV